MKLKEFIAKTPEARYISAAWCSWLHCPIYIAFQDHYFLVICYNRLFSWSLFLVPKSVSKNPYIVYIYILLYPFGWWLGTWVLFFHILGIIIPTDFHIFQRGWNHQPVMYRNSHVEYSSQEIHPFSIHVFFPLDENSSVIPQFFIQFRTPLVPAVAQFWAIFIQGAPKG